MSVDFCTAIKPTKPPSPVKVALIALSPRDSFSADVNRDAVIVVGRPRPILKLVMTSVVGRIRLSGIFFGALRRSDSPVNHLANPSVSSSQAYLSFNYQASCPRALPTIYKLLERL